MSCLLSSLFQSIKTEFVSKSHCLHFPPMSCFVILFQCFHVIDCVQKRSTFFPKNVKKEINCAIIFKGMLTATPSVTWLLSKNLRIKEHCLNAEIHLLYLISLSKAEVRLQLMVHGYRVPWQCLCNFVTTAGYLSKPML